MAAPPGIGHIISMLETEIILPGGSAVQTDRIMRVLTDGRRNQLLYSARRTAEMRGR